jgi:hypothetical protein
MTEATEPLFQITIDTARPPLARHVAAILEQLNEAFKQHQLDDKLAWDSRRELRLGKLYSGSLIADVLVVLGGIVTIHEFRRIAANFIVKLQESVRERRGESHNDKRTALISALSAPVKHDAAKAVILMVHGDNSAVLVIDSANIQVDHKYDIISGSTKPIPETISFNELQGSVTFDIDSDGERSGVSIYVIDIDDYFGLAQPVSREWYINVVRQSLSELAGIAGETLRYEGIGPGPVTIGLEGLIRANLRFPDEKGK